MVTIVIAAINLSKEASGKLTAKSSSSYIRIVVGDHSRDSCPYASNSINNNTVEYVSSDERNDLSTARALGLDVPEVADLSRVFAVLVCNI